MEVLATEISTSLTSMAVEDTIVSNLNLVVNIEELLNIHVIVFHVISLSNITDYTEVISFTNKFKSSDSKSISRLKIVMLRLKQHFVKTTRLFSIHV
jgi:hypothetical protein